MFKKVIMIGAVAIDISAHAETTTLNGVVAKQRCLWDGDVDIIYECASSVVARKE